MMSPGVMYLLWLKMLTVKTTPPKAPHVPPVPRP